VVACDINEAFMDKAKTYWKEAGIEGKVDARVAPATETLDKLIENEEAGTYDFAFIDADKVQTKNNFVATKNLLGFNLYPSFSQTTLRTTRSASFFFVVAAP
jgi:predicted O-methyltransferase YrrM